MNLRSQAGRIRRTLLQAAFARRAELRQCGPIVSFTFDDFPRTALTIGGSILRNYGFYGTYYTAMSLMDTCNGLGEHFRREDLSALLEDGHELASHTYGHTSSRSVSCSAFTADAVKGRMAVESVAGKREAGNFAFPFGDVTLKTKREIGAKMASCRSIWGGFNGPVVDLNLLRANSLYGNQNQSDRIRKLIEQNEHRRTWLIFYSHDVQDNPSPFGCTPELLQLAVSFAAQTAGQVLTVGDVVAELNGRTPGTNPGGSEDSLPVKQTVS